MERDLRDFLDGVRERLNFLKKKHQIDDDLGRITEVIAEKAENQRRDFGPAYSIGNDLRETSKDFIKSLECGDLNGSLKDYHKIFEDLWLILGQLDLVPHFASQQDADSGGELCEAEGVFEYHSLLFNNKITGKEALTTETRKILMGLWYRLGDPAADPMLASLVDQEDKLAEEARKNNQPLPERVHRLTLTYRIWLAGIGDVPGEVSKFVTKAKTGAELEEGPDLTDGEGKNLIIRFLHIARTTYHFIANFETCYPQVINNSQRKGWFNTYRGMLGRVAGLINRRYEDLERIVDQEKFLAKMEFLIKTPLTT